MLVTVKIYFFAKAREIVGKHEAELEVSNVISYAELLDKIVQEFNLTLLRNSFILALNKEYCEEDEEIILKPGDELAVIPPLSDAVAELVASPKCGATSLFVGTTRDNFDGKSVVELRYEAYEEMCVKVLKTICSDLRNQWPNVENVAIHHRLGVVPVKEASIVIAVSSPHRLDAMQATQWCIDNVKTSVPIWKKEYYANNSSPEWKENKEFHSRGTKRKQQNVIIEQEVEPSHVPSHLIQIKASCENLNERICNFVNLKRNEINRNNVRDFCRKEASSEFETSCARIESVLLKRKDAKGHLQVNRVYNNFNRDQNDLKYLTKYIPQSGVEERLQNLETQLNMSTATSKDVFVRLKNMEDRLLYLESISPEYIHFWNRLIGTRKPTKSKRIYTLEEVDDIILNLELKKSSRSEYN